MEPLQSGPQHAQLAPGLLHPRGGPHLPRIDLRHQEHAAEDSGRHQQPEEKARPLAYEHQGQTISTILTPKDCLRCHEHEVEEFSVKEAEKREDLPNKVLIEDAVDQEKSLVVARAFEPLSKAVVKQIAELGVAKIKVVDTTADDGIVIKCMKKDPAKNEVPIKNEGPIKNEDPAEDKDPTKKSPDTKGPISISRTTKGSTRFSIPTREGPRTKDAEVDLEIHRGRNQTGKNCAQNTNE